MIVIYEFNGDTFRPGAVIDEEGAKVLGTSQLADDFRRKFYQLRQKGIEPADHMDGILDRIRGNYRTMYFGAK